MMALARTSLSEDQMLEARQELDRQLRPYRGKMTADQLSMLEKQYLERNLLEKSKLPRLSLFYMRVSSFRFLRVFLRVSSPPRSLRLRVEGTASGVAVAPVVGGVLHRRLVSAPQVGPV